MEVGKFLSIDPEDLAYEQKKFLKKAIIERLKTISSAISQENFNKLDKMIAFSPAGDCAGTDVDYIDFSDIISGDSIGDAINKLIQLTKIIEVNNDN